MTTLTVNTQPDEWIVTERQGAKAMVQIWKTRAANGAPVFVNPQAGTVWSRSVKGWKWLDHQSIVINGLYFGKPDKIAPNGTARWTTKKRFAYIVTRLTPVAPALKPKPDAKKPKELPDILHKAEAVKSWWANDTHWIGRIRLNDVPFDSDITTEIDLPNDHGGWLPVNFRIEGTARYHELKYLAAQESASIRIRFRTDVDEPTKHQVIELTRPTDPRPSTGDWWEKRFIRIPVEQRHQDFDDDHLAYISNPGFSDIINEDEHYKGAAPINVQALPSPGGFAITWGWADGEGPVPRHDRRGWLERETLRAWSVRVWYRNARLRGSGAVWRCSVNTKHQRADGGAVMTIPISHKVAEPGDAIDIMVQGISWQMKHLPPSHWVTTLVGDKPVQLTATPRFSMGIEAFRKFPSHAPPLTLSQYAALVKRIRNKKPLEAAESERDPAFNNTAIKLEVLERSKRISTAEMRRILGHHLPRFVFDTDNFGAFNALPEDIWETIIEATDTDELHYDPVINSCANFAVDFMAAAQRFGAKALIIWDYGGGHAYNILPVLDGDGEISLRFLEPQTDGEPAINPQSGQYRLNRGGKIFGW